MKKSSCVILLLLALSPIGLLSQQNTLFIHTYFKDKLLSNSDSNHYVGSSFFPIYESQFDLKKKLRDTTRHYYDFTETLFKKHLFETRGKNYYLTISPAISFALGTDRADSNSRRLFQNTRGIVVEGDLFTNFSFTTAFYENQARFTQYESDYYRSIGELYPNQSGGFYTTQNAVIPGGARTKPFKNDGFDYAFAVGNIVYKVRKNLILSAGNTSHFIGDGYRSILLSDNSVPAPFVRATFQISDKWEFNFQRQKLINLIRKPVSTTVEAYYEPKSMSINYLTYRPHKNTAISLFEGIIWSKGDSISSYRLPLLYYNPIPIVSAVLGENTRKHSVIGLSISTSPFVGHRFYGQFALSGLGDKQYAYQLGYRGYNFGRLHDFLLQIEYNFVAANMYLSQNSRLNYLHYNLPLAHVKGTGFQELIVRANYEYKRFYADSKTIIYFLKDYSPVKLLVANNQVQPTTGTTILQQIEIGYRINKKMNLTIFGSWQYRLEEHVSPLKTSHIAVGLRTGILNHYNDF
jgi:hypothetical protein